MKAIQEIDPAKLPVHIGIIMDGNGRWAKKRFLPRSFGHTAGVEAIRTIVKECSQIGIRFLTLYAFSTENWNRPSEEVGALMSLLSLYLKNEVKDLHKNQVRIRAIGDLSPLPAGARGLLEQAMEQTQHNQGLTMSLALNYGARDDIKNALVKIAQEAQSGRLDPESIGPESLRSYLSTHFLPDPDLIIRPSGEQRLSNFMLWECAYSELWFADIYWPDFGSEDLRRAILDFQNRDRRYGSVK